MPSQHSVPHPPAIIGSSNFTHSIYHTRSPLSPSPAFTSMGHKPSTGGTGASGLAIHRAAFFSSYQAVRPPPPPRVKVHFFIQNQFHYIPPVAAFLFACHRLGMPPARPFFPTRPIPPSMNQLATHRRHTAPPIGARRVPSALVPAPRTPDLLRQLRFVPAGGRHVAPGDGRHSHNHGPNAQPPAPLLHLHHLPVSWIQSRPGCYHYPGRCLRPQRKYSEGLCAMFHPKFDY